MIELKQTFLAKHKRLILICCGCFMVLAIVVGLLFSFGNNQDINVALNEEKDSTIPSVEKIEENTPIQSAETLVGEMIKELRISQQLMYFSNTILEANQTKLQDIPRQIAFHPHAENDHIMTIGITLNEHTDLNQYIKQGEWINISGANIETIIPAHGFLYWYFKLTDITDNIVISIDGLEPITLIEMVALDYQLTQGSINHALLNREKLYADHARLFVARGTTEVDFQFSEPMVLASEVGNQQGNVSGKWLSEDTYRFYLQEIPEGTTTTLSLKGFYSLRGNQPWAKDQYITVYPRQHQEWLNGLTGETINLPPRAQLYDAIRFSPNGEHYLGITRTLPEGDGIGLIYSITLEKNGQEQVRLEENLYTHLVQDQLPVVWLSDEEFIYFANQSINLYDLNQDTTRKLYEYHEGFSSAYVDVENNKLYFYTPVRDSEHEWRYGSRDFHVYDLKSGEHIIHEEYTTIASLGELFIYHYQPMNINRLGDSLLVTIQKEDGGYYTRVYQEGNIVELRGALSYTFADGVLLTDLTYDLTNAIEKRTHYWWNGTGNPVLLDEDNYQHYYYRQLGPFLVRSYENGSQREFQVWRTKEQQWRDLTALDILWIDSLASWPYVSDVNYTIQVQEIMNKTIGD